MSEHVAGVVADVAADAALSEATVSELGHVPLGFNFYYYCCDPNHARFVDNFGQLH